MRIGYVGLGKLGLPVALAAEDRGMEVKGVDPDPRVQEIIATKTLPYLEEGGQELLDHSKIELVSMEELVSWADLVFVAIQTPHHPQFGGEVPVKTGVDFDYNYLLEGLDELSWAITEQEKRLAVAIISTCLPGTFQSQIKPVLSPLMRYIYNPYFIAMGTTIYDFYHPEFILLGVDGVDIPTEIPHFYNKVLSKHVPRVVTDPTTAELIKMSYNTFIGQKIIFANAVMELSEKLNADTDTVSRAMSLADRRLISSSYLWGGMGDGGGCHPRDNVALWWLAEELDLSHNIYRDMMDAREDQTRWLAKLFIEESDGLPLVILGRAYKPETNLTNGSPASLLETQLRELHHPAVMWDPYCDSGEMPADGPAAYFIATRHQQFEATIFPMGSVVIDPWRYIPNQEGVTVIRVGQRRP